MCRLHLVLLGLNVARANGCPRASLGVVFYALFILFGSYECSAHALEVNRSAVLLVDASPHSARQIPETLFGIFFEEINHAGAGGLWAELVSNRGFEAGGTNTPSNIDPWSIIGNEPSFQLQLNVHPVLVGTLLHFEWKYIVTTVDQLFVRLENIEEGKSYKVVLHVKSTGSVNLTVSLTNSDGFDLASSNVIASAADVSNWTKVELELDSTGTDVNSTFQLRTTNQGVIWFDQLSVMPLDTYKGHGFRKGLFSMLADLKPRFIRFPGGCFVEGDWLRNAFRWKATVGPWEERPGHFGDVWMYWTDDGLGYFEFLQLAEDLGAAPVWVVNNGISHNDQVDTTDALPFVQEILDSIEFARGSSKSTWGSVRAAMGHPDPFDLKYVAIGNEDCGKKNYLGNYLKFYQGIKDAYPDIKLISNCDGSSRPLNHPADLYDFHVYTSANNLFSMNTQFDRTARAGPKAFVSEYAVTGSDAGTGSLLASLAEAAFLMGLEKNSDVVEMASYAPLFVNVNDRRWNPDAIVFNSWQQYGTPSYWMQQFFKESSGATLNPTTIQANFSGWLVASAVTWQSSEDNNSYLKIKIVNFGSDTVNLKISVSGLQQSVNSVGSSQTVLTSSNVMDENSFDHPNKVVPAQSALSNAGTDMDVVLSLIHSPPSTSRLLNRN
uniref:non-reducing end alpha-L-arabinofuranosidase n=1 Tax=Ananas comosus var. bracteatus TaxID=296719 RepID=A0A6V7NFK8_ANACO|nr:unnamed protein product [Ananas comosus var. bracteatus]